MIEYIIIFEDMFADIEVASFDLFLDGGYIFRKHLALDERIAFGV